jgi:heat shock protein HslJ
MMSMKAVVLLLLPMWGHAGSHVNADDIKGLHKGEWLVVEVDGTDAADETNHTMTIADDDKVTGHTGCNAYTANAIVDGVDLSFQNVEVSENMCVSKDMENAETAFLAAMSKVGAFNVNVNVLRIYDSEMKEVLKLRRLGTVF